MKTSKKKTHKKAASVKEEEGGQYRTVEQWQFVHCFSFFNPSSCRGSRSSNLCRYKVYDFIVL